MTEQAIIAWDIGGAHLKVASLESGRLAATWQYATPLWQGLSVLDQAIAEIKQQVESAVCTHVVTMTGELVDVFKHRYQGVAEIIKHLANSHDSGSHTFVYAGRHGFVTAEKSARYYADIASANWHATASLLSRALVSGYLIDIGTTTTDIIPFHAGQVCHQGYTDQQRMRTDELIYTGVVRTPVMAIVDRVLFQGQWQSLAAECFATMADVYRLTGELAEQCDVLPTADGAGKRLADSRRRLARMLGTDVEDDSTPGQWQALAHFIAGKQYGRVAAGFSQVKSRQQHVADCIVAAGAGAFLVDKLAQEHGCRLYAFEDIVASGNLHGGKLHEMATPNCASAIALAQLFHACNTP